MTRNFVGLLPASRINYLLSASRALLMCGFFIMVPTTANCHMLTVNRRTWSSVSSPGAEKGPPGVTGPLCGKVPACSIFLGRCSKGFPHHHGPAEGFQQLRKPLAVPSMRCAPCSCGSSSQGKDSRGRARNRNEPVVLLFSFAPFH